MIYLISILFFFSDGTNCCKSGVQESNCFTIPIPSPDRFYSWVNSSAQCLNFVRSRPVCRSTVREQFNEITAFVDASNIYGSELEHSALLRTYRYEYLFWITHPTIQLGALSKREKKFQVRNMDAFVEKDFLEMVIHVKVK